MSSIRFLERQEIDVERWDRCVRDSPHSDVYALSGWLDIMAKRWSGLVQDDYAAVLPIPWNRKYFLYYIYTPRFTSPLPLCGNPSTTLTPADFLQAIPKRFVLWDLDMSTPLATGIIPFTHRFRTNFLLTMDSAYEDLFSGYRTGYRNLIRQAGRSGYHAQQTTAFAEIIHHASQKKKIGGTKTEDYARFQQACQWLAQQDMLETWETTDAKGNRCAGAVFAKTTRKLYYLLAWNNEEGRQASASHLLMDAVIKCHAGSGMVLDFEGSDHPGIAHFMKGFGACDRPYIHITRKLLH